MIFAPIPGNLALAMGPSLAPAVAVAVDILPRKRKRPPRRIVRHIATASSGDALDHERKIIVSFDSTFDVMECEQLCLDAGVPGRIMPLPGSITAGCGLCWAMPFSGDALAAFRAATEGRITPADYHQLVL